MANARTRIEKHLPAYKLGSPQSRTKTQASLAPRLKQDLSTNKLLGNSASQIQIHEHQGWSNFSR